MTPDMPARPTPTTVTIRKLAELDAERDRRMAAAVRKVRAACAREPLEDARPKGNAQEERE